MAESFPQTDQISVNNRLIGYKNHNVLYTQQNNGLIVSAPNYQYVLSHSQSNTSQYPINNEFIQQSMALNLNIPVHDYPPVQAVNNMTIKSEIKTEVKTEVIEAPSTSQFVDYPDHNIDIDIQIRNMTCHYTLPLHIDLRRIALSSVNVIYDRGRGALTMQRRNPNCYIKMFSSGVVYIVGCKTEQDCMRVARNVGRLIQKLMGKESRNLCMRNYQIKNVLATCRFPFGINVSEIARQYPKESQYEPELFVGLHWKSVDPKASLRIYTTGTIMVTGATSEADVMRAIENIYSVVIQFRCQKISNDEANVPQGKKRRTRKMDNNFAPFKRQRTQPYNLQMKSGMIGNKMYFGDEEEEILDDEEF